jgi:hypothetical protein
MFSFMKISLVVGRSRSTSVASAAEAAELSECLDAERPAVHHCCGAGSHPTVAARGRRGVAERLAAGGCRGSPLDDLHRPGTLISARSSSGRASCSCARRSGGAGGGRLAGRIANLAVLPGLVEGRHSPAVDLARMHIDIECSKDTLAETPQQ